MINIKALYTLTQQKIILPFYHAVSDDIPVHLKHLYKVRSINQFERDLAYLLKYYKPIDIKQLNDHVLGIHKIKTPSFLISFDDGLREFKEIAYPILKQRGIPSALFVNTDFVDNKKLFFRFKAGLLYDYIKTNKNEKIINEANKVFSSMIDSIASLSDFIMGIKHEQESFLDNLAELFEMNFEDYLNAVKPYITNVELQELAEGGVHIGAHSKNHPLFMDLNDSEKYHQLISSIEWIQENLTQTINSFSFPFTDFGISADFFKQIYRSESPKVHLTFGTAGIKKELLNKHVQRIPIEDYSEDMDAILQRQYLYYLAKAPFFKNTIRR